MGVMRIPAGASVRGPDRRSTTEMYVPLALGFLASAAFVTAAVAGAFKAFSGSQAAITVAAACLAALAALELTSVRRGPLRRQTSPQWPRVFGPRVGAMLWGLDTGSMVSTVRTTFGAHAVLVACVAGVAGGWAGVAYAGGFCLPLAVLLYRPLAGGSAPTWPSRLSGLMVALAVVLVA